MTITELTTNNCEKTMKVNCLKDSDRTLIHPSHQHGVRQMDLFTIFLELHRTIDRMLEEIGLATPVPRLDKEDDSLGPCC